MHVVTCVCVCVCVYTSNGIMLELHVSSHSHCMHNLYLYTVFQTNSLVGESPKKSSF